MPKKKTVQDNRLNVTFPDEQWRMLEILEKDLRFKPNKSTVVIEGIKVLFEQEFKKKPDSIEEERWKELEFLEKKLKYKPPKPNLINSAIKLLFEQELKEQTHLKAEWERLKQGEKNKIVPINKNKGEES